MADHNQPVIIIKKKKKGGHGGHHGGAWKVAYADFVTAMMAFFLLMWLLNVTTSDQRQGIADYFSPTAISQSHGGSGGVMGGTSITAPYGADISSSSPPGVDDRTTATVGQGEQGEEDVAGKSDKAGSVDKIDTTIQGHQELPKTEAERLAEATRKEEEKFKEAEAALKQSIQQAPELRELSQHLAIDRTPEGLRIQIIDQDKFSLFPSGSSIPYEKGRDLLRLVGKVIARLTNHLSISGHTDSNPFTIGSRRDNWTLSTERANISRSELVNGGVPDARVSRVVGLADRDPFVPNDPKDARNRRISIVLLREAAMKAKAAASATTSAPAQGVSNAPSGATKEPPKAEVIPTKVRSPNP